MILLGINCGLGPADLGRLRWNMIDLAKRRLRFPRPKTGTLRVGYLWRKTVAALLRVRELKYSRLALEREGDSALVFLTRKNLPYYREVEVHAEVDVGGRKVKKLVGVKVDNPIQRTFRRMVRELKLGGLTFYRLRHSFRTLAARSRDREAIDLCMGHKDPSMGKVYDHDEISWSRIRRVAKVVYRRLWPKPKIRRSEDMRSGAPAMRIVGDGGANTAAA